MNRLLPVIALAVLAYPAAPVSGQSGEENAKPPIFWDGGMIPDPGFRAYVLENFDTDRDGKISSEEADAVLVIDLGREEPTDTPGIKSLEGVEYFKNLRELIGAFHPLTSLRLSENTALTKLNCRDSQLTRKSGVDPIGLPRQPIDLPRPGPKYGINQIGLPQQSIDRPQSDRKSDADRIGLLIQSIAHPRSLRKYDADRLVVRKQSIDLNRSVPE